MFTIMESRKRPRLEMINKSSNNSNENMQGVASTTTAMATATYTTIEGQSFILSNSSTSPLPANILLSICDDNSNDSDEYILDHSSLLSPIKQEHTVATQTNNNQSQLPQNTLITTMPPYRIINQTGKSLNTTNLNSTSSSSVANNTTVNTNSTLMSNSVHLPSGCEIYVIKEVFDLPKRVTAESHNISSNIGSKALVANGTNITPMTVLSQQRNATLKGNTSAQSQKSNPTITINDSAPVTATTTTSITSSNSNDDTAKRSLILEAYKKRDDKRRAIHNEVERRRRDKINSWIFKLKEMLPADVTNYNQQGSATTTRTQPNDSKSQILIKACEYIKSMQEEIDSLRECLTENENLRLKNQRLQAEINNLRNKQQQQHNNNNNNNNNNSSNNNNSNYNSDNSDNGEITLNSLNTTYANVQLFAPSTNHLVDFVGLTANSNITSTTTPTSANIIYNKRELIITDYVD